MYFFFCNPAFVIKNLFFKKAKKIKKFFCGITHLFLIPYLGIQNKKIFNLNIIAIIFKYIICNRGLDLLLFLII